MSLSGTMLAVMAFVGRNQKKLKTTWKRKASS
jgi:hypothetical protein